MRRGFVAWFARHGVAANMLMLVILAAGLLRLTTIQLEVFPEVDSEMITVSVPFRGASPEEIEEGICIKIEEAVQGVEGIKKMTSRAVQGAGSVTLEVRSGEDVREVLDDVKAAVDAIDTFPLEADSPVVAEFELAKQVVNVAVSGDVDETTLRLLGERVRDEILELPGITRAVLSSVRPYEVSIEVSESDLRRYGLSFDELAAAVRNSSLDLSGGSVKTEGGEVLFRTKAQAYRRPEFEAIVLRSSPDGSQLLLGDVAKVVDAFEDTGQSSSFDGLPTAMVRVYRMGEQSALAISDAVADYVAASSERLPPGIQLTTSMDDARVLRGRMDLMLRNGKAGLLLVFLTLALFLRLSLAFWVAAGIPIAFLGAVALMPAVGVTINMISLFAFIVALGIVVDDAIVVGENIYAHHEKGAEGIEAALGGARQVMVPVIFAILTTVAAFSPLMVIPGTMGKFISQLPRVVVPILVFSMVESLLILPAHLSHLKHRKQAGRMWLLRAWEGVQDKVSAGLTRFVGGVYEPVLKRCLSARYVVLAAGLALVALTFSLFGAGHIRFTFFPDVEADNVVAFLTMPEGTSDEVTARGVAQIESAALALRDRLEADGAPKIVRHVHASVGDMPFRNDSSRGFGNTAGFAGRHLGEINVELMPGEDREFSSGEFLAQWRDAAGEVAGAVELTYQSTAVPTGDPIDVQFTGNDPEELRSVAAALRAELAAYPGVYGITDSFRAGKQEIRLDLSAEGRAAGLTRQDLARQVRQSFYGEEAQRIQRGRDEVRVMIRYPEAERRSVGDLDDVRLRLRDGLEMPLRAAAVTEFTRGDAVIERAERHRAIHVRAQVDLAVNDPNTILADVTERVLPDMLRAHPRVNWTLEGEQAEQADTLDGMKAGFLLALLIIYALLAVPFRSYVQPAIVMLAIPFGLAGALWGHLLLGMDVSIMSAFGVVALTGVLVNDSLVLVDYTNQLHRGGAAMLDAIRQAGPARFRAIVLTSLTTFAGLSPLLMERSLQAKFLIPMAVSLGFGVLFATAITLIVVPVSMLILHDAQSGWAKLRGRPMDVAAAAER
ncbi:MAG: multidrug transporter AcrB [Planctomycetota bacterium]|nr:MAG: multidrug transporter AcrB [Planctomycetota bacterium]